MAVSARYLALWLPAFRLERCGWSATDAVILVAPQKNAIRVIDMTPAASAQGIALGEPLASARARVHGITVEWWAEQEERRDETELVRAFGAFSDRVIGFAPSLLMLGVSGVSHLYGGEAALVLAILGRAAELGHLASAVICSDQRAAAALVRCGHPYPVVRADRTASALSGLPLAALSPGKRLLDSLLSVGITTIGQWADLSRRAVAERYGAWGVSLHRVALGEGCAHDEWVPPQRDPLRVEVSLASDVRSVREFQFAIQGALVELVERLRALGESAVRIAIAFRLRDSPPVVLRLRLGRPTQHLSTLSRLVNARLQGLRLPAPASALVVEVEEMRSGFGWQPSWTDRAESEELLPDLLARLGDDLGDSAIFEATLCPDWRPESAWRPLVAASGTLISVPRVTQVSDPAEHHTWREREIIVPRPVRLLEKPEPIEVRIAGQSPVAIRQRRGWEKLIQALGPERLQGGWWRPNQTFSRDYWVVRTKEGVAWIYNEGGAWYRHGWFD